MEQDDCYCSLPIFQQQIHTFPFFFPPLAVLNIFQEGNYLWVKSKATQYLVV